MQDLGETKAAKDEAHGSITLDQHIQKPIFYILNPFITCEGDMTKKSCRYLRVLILLCIFCIIPATAQTSNDYWAPWVTKTTTNSSTINWRGENNGSGLIDYATTSYFNQYHSFEKNISPQIPALYQHVSLTGLEPNTSYTYWVRPSGNESAFRNRTFRTMPVSGPFTFLVVCDSQEGSKYPETKRFKYVADGMVN